MYYYILLKKCGKKFKNNFAETKKSITFAARKIGIIIFGS